MIALTGARVHNNAHLRERKYEIDFLHSETVDITGREIEHLKQHPRKRPWTKFVLRWQYAVVNALQKLCSRSRSQVVAQEHTHRIEHYDAKKIRQWSEGVDKHGHGSEETYNQDELFVMHPAVDGRFKDMARS